MTPISQHKMHLRSAEKGLDNEVETILALFKPFLCCFLLSLVIISWNCGLMDESPVGPPERQFRTIDSEPNWSPDGRMITFTHLGQIWILDLTTMNRTFLTVGSQPIWSPNGKRIAFVWNNEVCAIDVATREIDQLTSWGSCFHPSWSPDGSMIAFDTNHGDSIGANVIWIMKADGSGKRDISQHGMGEWREPKWSRDGGTILHLRYLKGLAYPELFLMDTSGNSPVRLTSNAFTDRDPGWSRDGSKIAWGSYGTGDNSLSGIWVMNKDSTNKHQLTRGGGFPCWSPNDTAIVYYQTNSDSTTGTLWLMSASGNNQRQLTKP